MLDVEAREFVTLAYSVAFHRAPSEREFAIFEPKLISKEISPGDFIKLCINSKEYKLLGNVSSVFNMGHFHSPVVDPDTVREYVNLQQAASIRDLAGINIDVQAMRNLWLKHLGLTCSNLFSKDKGEGRYRFGDGPFPEGDSISLQIILAEYRPVTIIEIGSGFSSACMLDCSERLHLSPFNLICIEPYPERLLSLIRTDDKIKVLEQSVQTVDKAIVDSLMPGDILFIDSTHVMKTGSDLHYIFFYLIPRLRSGVIVHFHDIQFPFEYPDDWIFKLNYSWNEIYVLRAFLMYNNDFDVIYWHSLLNKECATEMNRDFTLVSGNPGGSIWLRRR